MPQHPDSSIRIRFQEETKSGARIKVVGVGGGGINAVNRMIESGMDGVEFISINTDLQSLQSSKAMIRLQLGTRLTRGLGTGANSELGRLAALEDSEKIIEALEDADMVFVTAGLGGGTGTGAAPVIASLASQLGALTVAVVTRPFAFEGKRRMTQAERGVQELLDHADTLIVIPNEKLLTAAKNAGFFESFRIADDILRQAVQGISDIVTGNGVINRDFADVRTTMAGMGYAVMGSATRTGPHRAAEAAIAAITSPLLEEGAIDGARGILINITGSSSLKLSEVSEASTIIQSVVHEDANIIFGAILDERFDAEVKVTVIAAGFREDSRNRAERRLNISSQVEPTPIYLEASSKPGDSAPPRLDVTPAVKRPPEERELAEPEAAAVLQAEFSAATPEPLAGSVVVEASIQSVTEGPVVTTEKDLEQAMIEATEPYFTNEWFEEDLLARIEGPAFDFDITTAEPEAAPRSEAPAQPEVARLRQTAVAAYASSSIVEEEEEEPAILGEPSFAEILASREKALGPLRVNEGAQDSVDTSTEAHELDIPMFLRRRV